MPNSGKEHSFPNTYPRKNQIEIDQMLAEEHIQKFDKCTSHCFVAPFVITVKPDDTIKVALKATLISGQFHKNKYRVPKVGELLDRRE